MNNINKIFFALFVITFAIIVFLEYNAPTRAEKDAKLWNNGFCICGSSWEYDRVVDNGWHHIYFFRCEKCNNIIGLREKVFTKSR